MTYYSLDRTPTELLASQLEANDDYRVLRRLPRREEIWCRSRANDSAGASVLAVVDTETTGLDCQRHRLIELASIRLTICNATGVVLDVEAPRSWLEDPGQPLTPQIENLTGLTDADLKGQTFDHEEIMQAFARVDAIAAHNAKFDAGFLAARFPMLDKPIACSMNEIDWPAHGLDGGRSIGALLTAAGHFMPKAHRAEPDAWALCCLLMMPDGEGKSMAWHLLDRARRPTARVYATGAPFALKDTLRAAGYRWVAAHRAWAIENEPERIANEVAWLNGLHPLIRPSVVPIDWHNRHIN